MAELAKTAEGTERISTAAARLVQITYKMSRAEAHEKGVGIGVHAAGPAARVSDDPRASVDVGQSFGPPQFLDMPTDGDAEAPVATRASNTRVSDKAESSNYRAPRPDNEDVKATPVHEPQVD